ncbi:MAG: hypothetical protein EOP49_18210, partial [Sphingobacteriales bacterium]
MNFKQILFSFTALLISQIAVAQGYTVSGHITDASDNSDMIGVTVVLTSAADTTQKLGNVTDVEGNFSV